MWHRRGLSIALFVIATVAVAAATLGPLYQGGAATSITRDHMMKADILTRGLRMHTPMATGVEASSPERFGAAMASEVGDKPYLDGPIISMEASRNVKINGRTRAYTNLAWRAGVCDNVTIKGSCPEASYDVMIHAPTAALFGWKLGDEITLSNTERPLHVVGLFAPKTAEAAYWFGNSYVTANGFAQNPDGAELPPILDSLFTAGSTLRESGSADVNVRAAFPIAVDRMTASDADDLKATAERLLVWSRSSHVDAGSQVSQIVSGAQDSTSVLNVPVLVISAQLVVLCWLLLFLVVSDLSEARGAEVALAKLRGYSRRRLLFFTLTEPVSLLLVAIPAGVLLGYAAARLLGGTLLRPGTPIGLRPMAFGAAALAIAGGLAATVFASRRVLGRSVMEQWRRAGVRPERRGWVVDVALLALTTVGIIQLVSSGTLSENSGDDMLSLIFPGILALLAALLAARVLPLACRALFRRTRRHGSIATFLALRQVARRAGGARTTIALTTSFALLTFAVSAWLVTTSNHKAYAELVTGADRVLTVTSGNPETIRDTVIELDPESDFSTVVQTNPASETGAPALLAVDPGPFSRIAHWRDDYATPDFGKALSQLEARGAPQVWLPGHEVRISVDVNELTMPRGSHPHLFASLADPSGLGEVAVNLGAITTGAGQTLSAEAPSCQPSCELRGLFVTAQDIINVDTKSTVSMTVREIATRDNGRWQPVPAGLDAAERWRAYSGGTAGGAEGTHIVVDGDALTITAEGLLQQRMGVAPATHPEVVPAIAAPDLGTDDGAAVYGLDGEILPIKQVARAVAIPELQIGGAVVDYRAAERVAFGKTRNIEYQVWLSPEAPDDFAATLEKRGLQVLDTSSTAQEHKELQREGPSLAIVLFLADAGAAAALAIAGAVLSLYATGRRRTYELAALDASGASRRSLRNSLLLEQSVVLGFGCAVGIGTGLLVGALALPAVPEFVTKPPAPPLLYTPDALRLGAIVAAAAILVGLAAWATSVALHSRVTATQLREPPA